MQSSVSFTSASARWRIVGSIAEQSTSCNGWSLLYTANSERIRDIDLFFASFWVVGLQRARALLPLQTMGTYIIRFDAQSFSRLMT
jgi:hypothetical protein